MPAPMEHLAAAQALRAAEAADPVTLAAYWYPPTSAQKRQGWGGWYELHRLDSRDGTRRILGRIQVNGIREARQQARIDGAKPWNF